MKKNMEQANYVKAIITGILAFLSSLLGILAIPCGLMVSSNSYRSIRGIFKKIAMWLLVVVGAIVDEMIKYSTAQIGIDIKVQFLIASIVAIWITCNEVISILENIQDIGVPIPGFLKPLVKNIRSQVEHQTDILENDEEEE